MKNRIYMGDCIEVLKDIPNESIDLIYLDPPFFSGRQFDIVWGNGKELKAYEDSNMYWKEQDVDTHLVESEIDGLIKAKIIPIEERDNAIRALTQAKQGRISKGDIIGYLDYMRPRLRELHRVLKRTGTIFLHCDKHAAHHLRLLLDEIFGAKNFLNEIIWYYRRWTNVSNKFQQMHDNIYWYKKGGDYTFNIQYEPYSEKTTHRKMSVDGKTNLEERRDIEKGIVMSDIWELPYLHSQSKERLGYPTQKPEALLERIVLAASNEGDTVLDPFAGGGVTAVVAQRLKRNWIAIDLSPSACAMIGKNLGRYGWNEDIDYDVKGMSLSMEQETDRLLAELKAKSWEDVEKYVAELLGFKWTGRNRVLSIDGIKGEEYLEVKHWKSPVGRDVVDKLAGRITRGKAKSGTIVGEVFTHGARSAAESFLKEGIKIELIEFRYLIREIVEGNIEGLKR